MWYTLFYRGDVTSAVMESIIQFSGERYGHLGIAGVLIITSLAFSDAKKVNLVFNLLLKHFDESLWLLL